MNWYAGNIAEAVNLAKTRGAVFVVYVEGTDELSQKLTSIINEEAIHKTLESTSFVAIKIQSDSEAYVQFAQIYKLVPLPSLFFIGSNGQPIDIVTGVIASSQELSDRIKNVASRAQINLPSSSTTNVEQNLPRPSTASTSQGSRPSEDVVCEGDVCRKVTKPTEEIKPTPTTTSTETPLSPETVTSTKSLEDKMKSAKQLLEKKKQEKEKEEAKRLKDQETLRRQTGRDLQSFKERQHELDLLQMKEERQKDKIADKAARKRILDQIAQDRAERAQKLNLPGTTTEVDSSKKYVPSKVTCFTCFTCF